MSLLLQETRRLLRTGRWRGDHQETRASNRLRVQRERTRKGLSRSRQRRRAEEAGKEKVASVVELRTLGRQREKLLCNVYISRVNRAEFISKGGLLVKLMFRVAIL
mmetsp:Transcript_9194/g.40249  ORF Transcript_9194/g.40249 Transcript_9194/m.40249 type:complete len:106 (+) Transcript_9194:2511-2828(+)